MKNLLEFLSLWLILICLGLAGCNPCSNTVCLNGGTCVDGNCLCADGYYGANCELSECANVVCQNGGYCENGGCNCPPGYSGSRCQTFDPCFNITCQNGGICRSGSCDCPNGFTGPTCATALTPSAFRVNKIVLTNFPETRNSTTCWDNYAPGQYEDCYPDIYVGIFTVSGNTLETSGYYENCRNSRDYSYSFNTLMYFNNSYQIGFRDYEFPGFETLYQGNLRLSSLSYSGGYKSSIALSANGGTYTFRLEGQWLF